jgi:hypothetical protein
VGVITGLTVTPLFALTELRPIALRIDPAKRPDLRTGGRRRGIGEAAGIVGGLTDADGTGRVQIVHHSDAAGCVTSPAAESTAQQTRIVGVTS